MCREEIEKNYTNTRHTSMLIIFKNLDKMEKFLGLHTSKNLIQKEVKYLNRPITIGEIEKKSFHRCIFFKFQVSDIPKVSRQIQGIEKKRNILSFYKARS